MLAQNFMSAEALGITEEQHEALIKTLRFFERGEIEGVQFNMNTWQSRAIECGTVCCIGGWAETLAGRTVFHGGDTENLTPKVDSLFYPSSESGGYNATITQGAAALRNYLTTGDSQWELVMETVE